MNLTMIMLTYDLINVQSLVKYIIFLLKPRVSFEKKLLYVIFN